MELKENEKTDNTKNKISIIVTIVVFVIVIAVAFTCCSNCGGSASEDKTGHTEVEAWTAAQLEVERNLKAPSTAKFPLVKSEDVVDKIDSNTFKVEAYVDSENSFGAMIRTYFSCTVEFTGEDTYIVRDLKFYE